VGARILNLTHDGTAVAADQEFAMAVDNYRRIDMRQLLIDWVTAHQTIDRARFASVDWRLVSNGAPTTVT
jgi:2',3'-cyclic-nucleotide 2'-phosphodiesterase/3'-nucleotidase